MRQQYLRSMQTMDLERRFIYLDQSHLPDRRHRLQFVQCARAFLSIEPLHASSNRTRSHEHDFDALLAQCSDLASPAAN